MSERNWEVVTVAAWIISALLLAVAMHIHPHTTVWYFAR